MAHWTRLRPMLVMAMLFTAPAAALAHLLTTWVPETLAMRDLTRSAQHDAREFERQCGELEQLRQGVERLRDLAREQDAARAPWLSQREQHRVSDTLAKTLQGDGATIEKLTFHEVSLFAAHPQAGVLACEQVTVACRGPYDSLTQRLDSLVDLDLPIRVARVSWRRGRQDIELTLCLEIPFVPSGELEKSLRDEAGYYEDDEEDDEF